MSNYKKLIVLPCLIILICGYIIGFNFLKRVDRVGEIAESKAVTEANSTKATENIEYDESKSDKLKDLGYKININTADKDELMLLEGIGESYAEKIIEFRESNGGFKSVEQLKEVKGIGDKKFDEVKDFITVE